MVMVPTYNEVDNIQPTWQRLRQALPMAGILIVDDNSPDGTGAIADRLAATDPLTWVLHRPAKSGLGRAYADAMAWGLDHGARFLVQMDADGSHDPAALPQLLEVAQNGADLVIGSRYVAGGSTRGWSHWRLVLSHAGNTYARLMLRLDVHDATSGYRVFSAAALRRIQLGTLASKGYCFLIEMTLAATATGLVVREVPIIFTERELGASKMSWAVGAESLWNVTRWRLTGRHLARRTERQHGSSKMSWSVGAEPPWNVTRWRLTGRSGTARDGLSRPVPGPSEPQGRPTASGRAVATTDA